MPEFVYSSVCSNGQPASSPFPSAPPRTGHARFPSIQLSSDSTRMARIVLAFCISHTFTPWPSNHLPPFAMWLAFPTADYYGDSVTMGLAPVRPSHVPSVLNVSSVT